MAATLSLSPNPIAPSGTLKVSGSGFDPRTKYQLALDGVGWTSNVVRPTKKGTFSVGMNVSSTPRTQTVAARNRSTRVVVATATVVVAVPAPPPVSPGAFQAGVFQPSVFDTR